MAKPHNHHCAGNRARRVERTKRRISRGFFPASCSRTIISPAPGGAARPVHPGPGVVGVRVGHDPRILDVLDRVRRSLDLAQEPSGIVLRTSLPAPAPAPAPALVSATRLSTRGFFPSPSYPVEGVSDWPIFAWRRWKVQRAPSREGFRWRLRVSFVTWPLS